MYLDKSNAYGVDTGFFFFASFYVLSNYLNCEAVVFLMKTVIPLYMLLEGGTTQ